MAGAGAAWANSSKLTTFYDESGQKGTSTALNVAVGAGIGFGLTHLVHLIGGQGKSLHMDTPKKWIEKYNQKYDKDFIVYDEQNMEVISASAESVYKAKTLRDAMIFVEAFPYSKRKDEIAQQCLESNQMSRSDYASLLGKVLPNNAYTKQIQEKYLALSNTLDELYEATSLYPNLHQVAENKIYKRTQSPYAAIRFLRSYPKTSYKKQLLLNIFSDDTSPSDIEQIKTIYGSEFWLTKKDLSKLSTSTNGLRNYFRALFLVSKINSTEKYLEFLEKYAWLSFSDKGKSIIDFYWDMNYSKFSDGNELVALTRDFSDNAGRKYGTSISQADDIIWQKLKAEQSKIRILSKNILESNSPKWDEWLKNTQLTAGLVSEKGSLDYIIYGEIENTSKFDLPVILTASGDLYMKHDVSTKGKVGIAWNILKLFLRFDGRGKAVDALEKQSSSEEYITSEQFKYYVPNMRAKSKSVFAIKMGFGDYTKKRGINIEESVVITEVIILKNESVAAEIEKHKLSQSQASIQNYWNHLAKNGLPAGKVYDVFAGEEYSPEKWQDQYQRQIEEERQRRLAWEQLQNRLETETQQHSSLNKHTEGVRVHARKTGDADYIYVWVNNDDWWIEDADEGSTRIQIIPNESSGEESITHKKNTDVSASFYRASSVTVHISYSVKGKSQSASVVIRAKGKWQIDIED